MKAPLLVILTLLATPAFAADMGVVPPDGATDGNADLAIEDDAAVPVQFNGNLIVELMPDGRSVRLIEPYEYIDPAGMNWPVPAETIVDGASIPQPFWSIIGGPFEGKYRNASVIHDFYCEKKDRPWETVHRVFYEAMVESEVDQLTAKIMYYAVYFFGPRWELGEATVSLVCTDEDDPTSCGAQISEVAEPVPLPAAEYDAATVKADIDYILQSNPSLDAIETLGPPPG